MKKHLVAAMMTVAMAMPVALPTAASAQYRQGRDHRPTRDYRWQGDNSRNWDPAQHYQARSRGERRLTRKDRIYRGRDGRAYCRRNDGTTGLVVGAVGGGVLANLVGGNTLETLLGAGAGAALGNAIDRGQVRCR